MSNDLPGTPEQLLAHLPHFQNFLTDLERRKSEEFRLLYGNEAWNRMCECGIDRRRGYETPSPNSLEHQVRSLTKLWSISIFISMSSYNIDHDHLFSPERVHIFIDHFVNSFANLLNSLTSTSTAELPLLHTFSRLVEHRVQLSTTFLGEFETFVTSFIVLLLRPHVTSGVIRHNFHLRFIPYLRRLMTELTPIIRTANSNNMRFTVLAYEINRIRERVERYRRLETQLDLQMEELQSQEVSQLKTVFQFLLLGVFFERCLQV